MIRINNIIILMFLSISIFFRVSFSQENGELLVDTGFDWGLKVLDPSSGQLQGSIIWQDIDIAPFWELGQWSSHSSAIDIFGDTLDLGMVIWADSNKILKMGTRQSEGYDLYLGVNSENEFGGVYRTSVQPWPHLLVQQRISPPENIGPGCEPLLQLSELLFQVDACLDTVNIIKKEGYYSGIHAAQFLIYFTVQNLGSNPKLFGKYVWLGVQVYDDRNQSPPKYVAHDDGTKMLIYSIAYDETADSTTHSGKWVHFKTDLLPHAKSAVTEAWNRGYFSYEDGGSTVTPPLNFDDYKIGGMNMGWEAPGMFYAAFKVRNLSLRMSLATAIEQNLETRKTKDFRLYKNYPNPFNPKTVIGYQLSVISSVELTVYNYLGQRVQTLVNEQQQAGMHSVSFDGSRFASGVYFYKLQAGDLCITKKMLLVK